MGATTSNGLPQRARVNRPFGPGEFAVAWLTFKGDSVENAEHRYVAKKDGLLTSKLLLRLYGNAIIQCFANEEGEFVSREMFVCTLALCYDGNTEDRISYIFTMYSIIYGLEREGEGCMMKKDYVYLLNYLEGFTFIPKKLFDAYDECGVAPNGRLLNSQFVDWVRKYPVLMDFLASQLPTATGSGLSPMSVRTSDDFTGRGDPLNSSPSCRERDSALFGSFDFLGGEDSGDDSDEAYDSEELNEMDEFGEFQSAPFEGGGSSDKSDSEVSPDLPPDSKHPQLSSTGSGRRPRGSRTTRGVHKMGRNLTKGISKVGRSILHGPQPHTAASGHHASDVTSATLLAAGYEFSSELQITKNYVCGYLHKISDSKWAKRSWHRRWFVLDRQQGVLSYYRHNPANNLVTSTPRGNIIHMEDDAVDGVDESNSLASTTSSTSRDVGVHSSTSTVDAASPITSPRSMQSTGHHMLYLNKSHPWYRGELNLNLDSVSLLFEKSLARNAPTKYFFQVSTLSLQEMIDTKRGGVQYKLCAESEDEFDQWTAAIAAAINRKHAASAKTEPTLSHQQLYRQKLREQQERAATATATAAAATASTAATPHTTGGQTIASVSLRSLVPPANSTPTPTKPTPTNLPPRIITSTPTTTQFQGSPWRLHITIDGSKQCLIVGFIVNMVALKCVAPEHALWKLAVCIAVSCAYVASIYNPPRRIATAHQADILHASLDSSIAGTDSVCLDPEHCCLHRQLASSANNANRSVPNANELGVVPTAPALVTPPVGGFKKLALGSSMAKTDMVVSGRASATPQSWTTTAAEHFQVRSVDYKKTKRKEPSKAALFEFLGADLLRTTDGKVDLISQRLQLPPAYADDKVFIINAQLPSYGPSVWGDPACDGPGFSLVLCWRIPRDVCEQLRSDTEPASKELRLFKRFQQAANDVTVTDRFKVIAQVTNQDECGLTGMAKKLLVSHNATPVLTRPQHRIYHFNEGSTEIVVDVHAFSYIARRGIHMLLDKCAKLVIDVAFVLQGENEDELPERILGCCRLDCVDVAKAMDLPR